MIMRLQTALSLLFLTILVSPCSVWALGAGKAQQLAAMPELQVKYPELPSFGKGEIFVVFAHADDELTVLGQVAHYRELYPNRAIHWIMVSDSAAGKALPWTCLLQSKEECRFQEAAQVAHCVGIDAPMRMRLPDGGLAQVPKLSSKIWAKINEVKTGPIALIISHDATGLYGHPDHVAVHDALFPLAKAHGIPYVSIALPEFFKKAIEIRDPFKSRERPSITHQVELDPGLQEKMVCAHSAYQSQEILLWFMDQNLPANEFYAVLHRMYFHLTLN